MFVKTIMTYLAIGYSITFVWAIILLGKGVLLKYLQEVKEEIWYASEAKEITKSVIVLTTMCTVLPITWPCWVFDKTSWK